MSNAFEQSLFVFFREDLHELLKASRPIVENVSSSLTSRVEEVTIDQVFQDAFVCLAEVPGAVVARSGLVLSGSTAQSSTLSELQRFANVPSSS